MLRLMLLCALVIGGSAAAGADDLQLVGIMAGSRPTAIVNDQVVAVGDSVGSQRVVEIGTDHVVFEGPRGRLTKHLKELETKETPKAAPVNKPKPAVKPQLNAPPSPAPMGKIPQKAGKHLDQSIEYLRDADELLKSQLKFNDLYERAGSFCANAAREAQLALNMIADEPSRKSVAQHITQVQKVQRAITRERDDFNTRVRTAIVNRQVFAGMTQQNVISSWGPPLSKTTIAAIERWVYKDPNGYQRNLNFSKGVLVSF
jgi:hypothetical protein